MAEDTKRCSRCGLDLPVAMFGRNRAQRDGLHYKCKPCNSADARAWQLANPERHAANVSKWRAENPDRVRQRDRVRATTDSYRAKARARYAANPERKKLAVYRWRDANPDKIIDRTSRERCQRRRALLIGSMVIPFTRAQLALRLSMFAGCWVCGGPASEVDHVKPLSKGGAHMLSNLRPICKRCNVRKSARWPVDTRLHPH